MAFFVTGWAFSSKFRNLAQALSDGRLLARRSCGLSVCAPSVVVSVERQTIPAAFWIPAIANITNICTLPYSFLSLSLASRPQPTMPSVLHRFPTPISRTKRSFRLLPRTSSFRINAILIIFTHSRRWIVPNFDNCLSCLIYTELRPCRPSWKTDGSRWRIEALLTISCVLFSPFVGPSSHNPRLQILTRWTLANDFERTIHSHQRRLGASADEHKRMQTKWGHNSQCNNSISLSLHAQSQSLSLPFSHFYAVDLELRLFFNAIDKSFVKFVILWAVTSRLV